MDACRRALVKKVRFVTKPEFSADVVAISLAGHLGLDNLILVYDNNAVTVDGNIDACFTDDTSAKLRAMGWETIDVYDGSNDVSSSATRRGTRR